MHNGIHLHDFAVKKDSSYDRRRYNVSETAQVRESHRVMLADHHESFHSTWGQLLKTGYQNSRFAHQVGFPAASWAYRVKSLSGRMHGMMHRQHVQHAVISACS